MNIPISTIHLSKTNVRKTFDEIKLKELADSIKTHGIINPILVRTIDGKEKEYELVAGERRFKAGKKK